MDKPKFIEQREELLKDIILDGFNDDPNTIQKITFVTSDKNITWKPKINQTKKVFGLTMNIKVPMNIEQIPENLKELSHIINTNGKTAVLMNYFETDFNGETYYFITSEKTFNNWSICYEKMDSDIKIEEIRNNEIVNKNGS